MCSKYLCMYMALALIYLIFRHDFYKEVTLDARWDSRTTCKFAIM